MRTIRRYEEWVFKLVLTLFIVVVCGAVLLPFVHLLAVSFSSSAANVGGKVAFLPVGFHIKAYRFILSHRDILSGFRNSVLQTTIGTVLSLLLMTMCAYPLSKKIAGQSLIIWMIMLTMLFNGGMIPTYMMIKGLGLLDTIWAVILPFCITPYYLMLMMNFFREFPEPIEEAALIDGLNPIQILFRIVLPLSKPILVTMALFMIVFYWNNWFSSLIYLNKTSMYPVMLIVRNILDGQQLVNSGMAGQDTTKYISTASLKAASIMVTSLPIFILLPFTQKYFTKGALIGAVKG
ncbi:carbohydrate ABC transporter permease [Paenibacillus pedocola]|uniref:carbohydrate ABC transporter permease n=1 Tax=Paenibacillus pedocola TaxID=3242193 RepID=UPI0028779C2C|nr:carbohydrate ABC transporter permease [Paenibacillus typhae]